MKRVNKQDFQKINNTTFLPLYTIQTRSVISFSSLYLLARTDTSYINERSGIFIFSFESL